MRNKKTKNTASYFSLPPALADKILEPYTKEQLKAWTILDPAAGRGELADAVNRTTGYFGDKWNFDHLFVRLDCIEPVRRFQDKLKEAGHTLINPNFLGYEPNKRYRLILMNPPIEEAEDYLLHAWKILPYGEIVAVMPDAVFSEPVTAKQETLCQMIEVEKLGQVVPLVEAGPDMIDADPDRPPRPVVVYLKKEPKRIDFEMFNEYVGKNEYPEREPQNLHDQDRLRETVRELVQSFDRARACFSRYSPVALEYSFYKHLLGGGEPHSFGYGLATETDYYNSAVAELKEKGWSNVFRLTRAEESMSAGARQDFENLRQKMIPVDFTEANVLGFLHDLRASQPEVARKSLVEAFDNLTLYYPDNREAAPGFRNQDAYRVKKDCIINGISSYSTYRPEMNSHAATVLDDLDRAMATLEGKRLGDVRTIRQAFREMAALPDHHNNWSGKPFISDYFKCSCYKKGSVYIRFLDPHLLDLFNQEAAKGKDWMPQTMDGIDCGPERVDIPLPPELAKYAEPEEQAEPEAEPVLISEDDDQYLCQDEPDEQAEAVCDALGWGAGIADLLAAVSPQTGEEIRAWGRYDMEHLDGLGIREIMDELPSYLSRRLTEEVLSGNVYEAEAEELEDEPEATPATMPEFEADQLADLDGGIDATDLTEEGPEQADPADPEPQEAPGAVEDPEAESASPEHADETGPEPAAEEEAPAPIPADQAEETTPETGDADLSPSSPALLWPEEAAQSTALVALEDEATEEAPAEADLETSGEAEPDAGLAPEAVVPAPARKKRGRKKRAA